MRALRIHQVRGPRGTDRENLPDAQKKDPLADKEAPEADKKNGESDQSIDQAAAKGRRTKTGGTNRSMCRWGLWRTIGSREGTA